MRLYLIAVLVACLLAGSTLNKAVRTARINVMRMQQRREQLQ